MSDLYKTLLISRPQVLSSGGAGLLTAANNLSDVADVTTARTNLGVSSIQLASLRSTFAASGYLYSDGATSNRAQIQVPGTRGNLAGAPVASWVGWVDVPSSSSTAEVFGVSSSTTALASATAWSLGGAWSTNAFVLRANGATPASDFRTQTFSTLRTDYSGQRVWMEVRFTLGSTAPVLRINGVAIAGSAADGAGTDPDWLSASLVATNHLTGYNWPTGTAPLGQWLNAHLTDAESEAWRITGRPPAWVAAGGSMAVLNTGTFANSSNPYTSFTGASSTGFTATFTPGTFAVARMGATFGVQPGMRFRVTFDLTLTSGQAPSVGIGKYNSPSNSTGVFATAGANTIDFLVYGSEPTAEVLFVSTAATSYAVANFSVRQIGALSLSSVQPIAVLDDVTNIGGNQARLVGMTPVCERRDWRIVASTATSGNQQLLGGSVFAEPTRHRIDSWVVNNLGTTLIVSLGNVSAGTQYVSGAAYAAGRNEVTLATRFPTTANLWCYADENYQMIHTITGHRVGA